MKRFTKWCLILAGLLLSVGIALHAAGAIMGGWAESGNYFAGHWENFTDRWENIGGLLGETQKRESGAITDPITAIDVDVDCGDIILRQGECFSVSMEWNLRGFTVDYEVKDGVLKVESDSRSHFLNGLSGMKNEVTITVPAGSTLNSLELSTNLGDIKVDAAFTVDKADLSTDLGDIECENIWAAVLTVETDLGDIDIRLPGSKDDYLWKLETSLGELRVDKERMNGDTAVNTSIRGGKGSNRVNASSSLGDVSLSFAD